jgi:hypothetical protein
MHICHWDDEKGIRKENYATFSILPGSACVDRFIYRLQACSTAETNNLEREDIHDY